MSSDHVSDLSTLIARAKGINKWLGEVDPSCFSEQQHLNDGSSERVYWHYGYMVGLNDAIRLLTGKGALTHGSLPQGKRKRCSLVSPGG